MSILRVFDSKITTPVQLHQKIKYIHDPNIYLPKPDLVDFPFRIMGHGIGEHADTAHIRDSMMLPHIAFGSNGTRLAYHILLDFQGLLSPPDAGMVAWEINLFLRNVDVQFIQGVHISKEKGRLWWPHVHVVCSTRIMSGEKTGRKFHFYKDTILNYKMLANDVLSKHGLPSIKINYYGKDDYYVCNQL